MLDGDMLNKDRKRLFFYKTIKLQKINVIAKSISRLTNCPLAWNVLLYTYTILVKNIKILILFRDTYIRKKNE